MPVRCGALLEAALRCEERAIKDRSHATHDGTCPVPPSEPSESRGKKIKTYEVKKSAQTTGVFRDGQQG